MKEGRAIQVTLNRPSDKRKSPDNFAKSFAKLMFEGKVNPAMRMLNKQESLGVANLNENTVRELRKLHPEAVPAAEEILISGEKPYFDSVVFTNIDEGAIAKAAIRTRGAAGPSGMDAYAW